jgi:hypothetical protein
MTQLLHVPHATYYRHYKSSHTHEEWISDWVSLVEGEKYPIEGRHLEKWWSDHMTVSVEVEQTAIVGHPHSVKEVQYVSVKADTTFERFQIVVNGVDGGKFKLIMMHPTTLKPTATEDYIPINATASDLRNNIKDYYQDNFGSGISVTREMFDANGTNTTNATLCQKSIYNVTLTRLISGVSVSNLMATKTGTAASISFLLPGQVQ